MRWKTWSFALLVLALGGCAETNPGIEILGQLSEPEPEETGGCTYMPSETAPLTIEHFLDTSGGVGILGEPGVLVRYVAVLQMANRMLNLGNSSWPVMADPNSFTAVEAEVELRGVDGQPLPLIEGAGLPSRYRVPASGFVPSAGSESEIGTGVVTVEVIPPVYGDALRGQNGTSIVLALQVRGRTGGDSEQVTGEISFPINLCNGCLWGCNTERANAFSCFPGQDRVSRLICGP